MSVSLSPLFNGYQSFLTTGLPNNGGFIYTYAAGSTTPQPTYTTNTGAIANANPITLSADGRPPQQIWLTDGQAYKFVLTDALLNILPSSTFDNITGLVSASVIGSGGSAVLVDTAITSFRTEPGATAQIIYEGAIGPGGVPAPTFDTIRGVSISPAGTQVLGASAVAGYIQNRTVQGSYGSNTFSGAVALLGVGISDADNTSTWGIATICTDRTNQLLGTGLGRACFNEFDLNMTSPNSTASALIIGGTWLAQPASATGVTVFKPKNTGQWQYAFGAQDGATPNILRAGMVAASGNNVNSQTIDMYWSNATGVQKFTELQAQSGGLVLISSAIPNGTTTPGSLILNNGAIYFNPIIAPNTPGANQFVLYVDSTDNKLKARSGAGTITILAIQ